MLTSPRWPVIAVLAITLLTVHVAAGSTWASAPAQAGNGKSSLDLIEEDYANQLLDRNNANRYRQYAVLAPERLPRKYQSSVIGKDATTSMVRLARAVREIVRTREQQRVETPQQLREFHEARDAVETALPGGARDLRTAIVRDPRFMEQLASGDTRGAMQAIEWERRYRTDPRFRADQFVRTWRELGDRHEAFERRGDERSAGKVASQMTGLAKSLERDPQVESLLRGRNKELGMPAYIEGRVSQSLPNWIGWGRGRGIGR